MLLAFVNTRGWSEGKWRTLIKEGKEYDVIGVGETGWHNSIKWEEGGWTCIGKGRNLGEKKGGGVGVIMKEKEGRSITEVQLCKETENRLAHGKGDIITVKIKDMREVWWVTVVYMGVESTENYEENWKMYELMTEISWAIGKEKWVVMGDLNGHIGLNNERTNINGTMILEFAENRDMKIKNWELENTITWRDRGAESAIDYIPVNNEVRKKKCTIWKNEELDISDHVLIGLTCGEGRKDREKAKTKWREKWNLSGAD